MRRTTPLDELPRPFGTIFGTMELCAKSPATEVLTWEFTRRATATVFDPATISLPFNDLPFLYLRRDLFLHSIRSGRGLKGCYVLKNVSTSIPRALGLIIGHPPVEQGSHLSWALRLWAQIWSGCRRPPLLLPVREVVPRQVPRARSRGACRRPTRARLAVATAQQPVQDRLPVVVPRLRAHRA